MVGPTLRVVLVKQFTRLRDGDRFFYANDPALTELRAELEGTSLADVIARNSEATIQPDAFKTP
ncbi:MAG: peroxidase [Candidatus Eremiobacteraeota bacterium]|nr:peroxidase [Candidatus Eremiobacteraeota bacterium]